MNLFLELEHFFPGENNLFILQFTQLPYKLQAEVIVWGRVGWN
jgi:hypothetical protein